MHTHKKTIDQFPWIYLNKILTNWTQDHIKNIVYHDQVEDISLVQYMEINVIHYINKLKDGNHMIIQIAEGNTFGKIQYIFII